MPWDNEFVEGFTSKLDWLGVRLAYGVGFSATLFRRTHVEEVAGPAMSGRQRRKLFGIERALEQGDREHCFINVASTSVCVPAGKWAR